MPHAMPSVAGLLAHFARIRPRHRGGGRGSAATRATVKKAVPQPTGTRIALTEHVGELINHTYSYRFIIYMCIYMCLHTLVYTCILRDMCNMYMQLIHWMKLVGMVNIVDNFLDVKDHTFLQFSGATGNWYPAT